MDSSALDTSTFKHFAPLLIACQEYSAISGFRFKANFLLKADNACLTSPMSTTEETLKGSSPGSPSRSTQIQALAKKAAPVVNDFAKRIQAGEPGLSEELERALWITKSEGYRSAIIVSLRELDLWPPEPPPEGIADDDCAYEDVAASLETIAQRAYNDDRRRIKEQAGSMRTAQTASFLLDFADVVGDGPSLLLKSSDRHQELLDEFLMRVAEWHNSKQDCGFSPTFFQRLQLETAAGRLKLELEKVASYGTLTGNLFPTRLNCRENAALADNGNEMCFDIAKPGCCRVGDNAMHQQLQVEILAASNLGPPEYRVGDIVSGMFGTASLLQAYAEICLGKHSHKTKCGQSPGRREKGVCGEGAEGEALIFKNDVAVFPFEGEDKLTVRVFDRRKLQALVRGDPLIGETTLSLNSGFDDGKKRSVDVEIYRANQSAGKISLQYQLLYPPVIEVTPMAQPYDSVDVVGCESIDHDGSQPQRRQQAV